jgi:hypothetical protein
MNMNIHREVFRSHIAVIQYMLEKIRRVCSEFKHNIFAVLQIISLKRFKHVYEVTGNWDEVNPSCQ